MGLNPAALKSFALLSTNGSLILLIFLMGVCESPAAQLTIEAIRKIRVNGFLLCRYENQWRRNLLAIMVTNFASLNVLQVMHEQWNLWRLLHRVRW